jgi:aromatic-L-amino-acid decarboxylase
MIGDDVALARRMHDAVGKQKSLEQGTIALSICTFRYVPGDLRSRADDKAVTDYLNELNARIVTAMRLSGRAFVSNAHIGEKYLMRACIVNFRTTVADVELVPQLAVELGRELDKKFRPKKL